MPCADDPLDNEEYVELFDEHQRLKAVMCAVLTQLETDRPPGEFESFLKDINWKEAGVTESWLKEWWTEHKAQDDRRRREAAERQME